MTAGGCRPRVRHRLEAADHLAAHPELAWQKTLLRDLPRGRGRRSRQGSEPTMACRPGTLMAAIAAGLIATLPGGLLVSPDLAPRGASGATLPQAAGRTTQAGGTPQAGVIMLGTGTPVPDAEAWGPASAVVVGDRLFLVDAGAGVTRRLAAAGFPRIKRVEATFITHLHSDHTLGYPDLIFTTWIMGRREPLVVRGPAGLRRMTDGILDTWREDVDVRVKGLERETRDWLRVSVSEIQAGLAYDRDGVRVTAIPVPHGDWPAFAYRFDVPGRSITFAGDTAPNPALVKAARGSDILVHEVYNGKRVAPEARPGGESWPDYLRAYHTSDAELARVASQVQPGLLVLTHVLRLGGTDDEILQHIRDAGYTGRIVIAKDLDRF